VRYSLLEIQKKVRADPDCVYVAKTTGVDMIMQVRNCSAKEAVDFAREAVLSLSADCFSDTVRMAKQSVADVYGKVIDGMPWYIKLRADGDVVDLLSCHLPDRDIETRGGVVSCTVRPGRGP
jgi:hypothetical protein